LIHDLILSDVDSADAADMANDNLIDSRGKEILKNAFQTGNFDVGFDVFTALEFWCSVMEGCHILANCAVQSLVPLTTTYLCEAAYYLVQSNFPM
jgi:hypothetical protein